MNIKELFHKYIRKSVCKHVWKDVGKIHMHTIKTHHYGILMDCTKCDEKVSRIEKEIVIQGEMK